MSSRATLKNAGAVGIATLCSRILGLVREQVIAYLFGAGHATDAYNVAFRIPNLLRNLFAEGAMSASLIPVFTRTRIEEGEERAWRVAGLVFRVLFVFVAILSVFGIVFANDLVHAYAGSYESVPDKLELTVRMTRLMFPYFPLVALSAAFMGILTASGRFFLPTLSSALFNLVSVASGVAFAELISHGYLRGLHWQPIEGMAAGVILGGAVQAFSQLPLLYRVGYRFSSHATAGKPFPVWYRDPALRQMLALLAPGIVGLAATQFGVLINTFLATSREPGAVSWLNYAFRLMQFPIGLFGVSLATASLPVLSQRWASRDYSGFSETIEKSLKHVFVINLPASAGLAFLSFPIIELIFQHGKFSPNDAHATALALCMYAVGLTAYSAVKLLVPACYAIGNTRVPVIISVVSVGLTLVFNLVMVRWMGFSGLALGTSMGSIVNALALVTALSWMLRKKGSILSLRPILLSFAKNTAASLLMGFLVYRSGALLSAEALGLPLTLGRALRVAMLICEGTLLIMLFVGIFRIEEGVELLQWVRTKVLGRTKVFQSS